MAAPMGSAVEYDLFLFVLFKVLGYWWKWTPSPPAPLVQKRGLPLCSLPPWKQMISNLSGGGKEVASGAWQQGYLLLSTILQLCVKCRLVLGMCELRALHPYVHIRSAP